MLSIVDPSLSPPSHLYLFFPLHSTCALADFFYILSWVTEIRRKYGYEPSNSRFLYSDRHMERVLAAANTESGIEAASFWLDFGTTGSLIRVERHHTAGWLSGRTSWEAEDRKGPLTTLRDVSWKENIAAHPFVSKLHLSNISLSQIKASSFLLKIIISLIKHPFHLHQKAFHIIALYIIGCVMRYFVACEQTLCWGMEKKNAFPPSSFYFCTNTWRQASW